VNEKYGDANLDENEIKLLNTHEKLITPGRVIYLYRNVRGSWSSSEIVPMIDRHIVA